MNTRSGSLRRLDAQIRSVIGGPVTRPVLKRSAEVLPIPVTESFGELVDFDARFREQPSCFLDPQVGQVFQEGLPGPLAEQSAQMRPADVRQPANVFQRERFPEMIAHIFFGFGHNLPFPFLGVELQVQAVNSLAEPVKQNVFVAGAWLTVYEFFATPEIMSLSQ